MCGLDCSTLPWLLWLVRMITKIWQNYHFETNPFIILFTNPIPLSLVPILKKNFRTYPKTSTAHFSFSNLWISLVSHLKSPSRVDCRLLRFICPPWLKFFESISLVVHNITNISNAGRDLVLVCFDFSFYFLQ